MGLTALAKVIEAALEVVFPPKCAACGVLGTGICATCLAAAKPLAKPHCRQCNRALAYGDRCAACRSQDRRIDRVYVLYPYVSPLREGIQRLKYHNRRYLARDLATIAVRALPEGLELDAVVAVPLHPSRRRERGYNQSALLAGVVGELIRVPVVHDLLERTRPTDPQTSLPRARRWRNMRGAFVATRRTTDQRILLVDDVTTTGATIEAATRALKRRGAGWVGALVVARQPLEPPLDGAGTSASPASSGG